jgi:branched-chain amino acid transport system substrate-binding protein
MALVAVVLLVMVGCTAPEDAGSDASETVTQRAAGSAPASEGVEAPSGEPILVGANIEQSGGASVQGQAYANALEMAVAQINDEGGILGRPVELSIIDNATDEQETITATRRLAEEQVVAMIGPGTSPTTLASMEAIIETGVPTFSMGSSAAIVSPVEERPNVFKTPAGTEANVLKALADMEAKNVSNVGIIAVNNPYGDSGIQAWEAVQEAEQSFEIVGIERFEDADTDMTAQLSNLASAGADAIAVVAIPPGAPTVRRNAVENLGLDIPMYFDAGAGAELFIELAGATANGALVTHPPTLVWDQVAQDDPQYDVLQRFGSAYTEQFGSMSGFASYAWDALQILKLAIEDAGTTDREAVVQSIEGLGEYVGATGVYELSPEDHQGLNQDDMQLLTVEEGAWTFAE